MVEFRAQLPKDEAASLLAAMNAARDQFSHRPNSTHEGTAEQEAAPGVGIATMLDVARGFLGTSPEDRSGEDRTLVMVYASAENLARTVLDVPAGTSQPSEAVSHIEGGLVEAATAQKHACDNPVLGAIVDNKVLALDRTRRLVSKAQRRALLIRDRMRCFPGCHQTWYLKAHHRVQWSWVAGPTRTIWFLLLVHQVCFSPQAVHEQFGVLAADLARLEPEGDGASSDVG
jgi:hypothetical protein